MDILGKVDDEEVFKNFDWSTFFYTRLFNSLKTILQGKKEAYELKRAKSSKAVAYYNIKGYVLAFQTVVQAKLKLSTQEKAFMESRIRGDDNMEMEDDESMPNIDKSNDDIHHFQDDLHDGFNQDNMDKNDDHQNREDTMSNDQSCVKEQHTQDQSELGVFEHTAIGKQHLGQIFNAFPTGFLHRKVLPLYQILVDPSFGSSAPSYSFNQNFLNIFVFFLTKADNGTNYNILLYIHYLFQHFYWSFVLSDETLVFASSKSDLFWRSLMSTWSPARNSRGHRFLSAYFFICLDAFSRLPARNNLKRTSPSR
ncbi:Ulp1-like peptidase [Cucumis melo var. makuwa]|uniref:Ulp1-like peptidase n=1 Tax=Cucumis melo var. makuwa TaxID=1194695 RepID=A0A5D3BI02_CUCMM|nr:Ulp1-like peptidase [Cucumis melo var. makuwa]